MSNALFLVVLCCVVAAARVSLQTTMRFVYVTSIRHRNKQRYYLCF